MTMESAFELNPDLWVDEYGDALYRFALARVQHREIAEDLVQETFLAAIRSKEEYRGDSSEKTWLFAILKHKLIDYFRKSKNTLNAGAISDSPAGVEAFFNANGGWKIRPAHWSTNPGKAQENKEFVTHFYRCLAGLPERTANAFVFREIDGLSTDEIRSRLGITAANFWVILYRARMFLRRCLELVGLNQNVSGES